MKNLKHGTQACNSKKEHDDIIMEGIISTFIQCERNKTIIEVQRKCQKDILQTHNTRNDYDDAFK